MNLHPCPISSGGELVLPIEDGSCTPSEWQASHAEFYGSYPRKVKRPDSERAWKKVKPQNHDTFNAIMDGLEVWAGFWALKTDRDKIPYPATWLNAHEKSPSSPPAGSMTPCWSGPTPSSARPCGSGPRWETSGRTTTALRP